MRNKVLIIIGALMLILPTQTIFAASSEIHVTQDGKASISSAKVMQIVGNTFFARLYWGDSFIRLTIRANASTVFRRSTNEITTIAEVSDGDYLNVTGELQSQSDTLTINAASIIDSSVQKEQTVLSGRVSDINITANQFTLYSKENGIVTVNVATSTQFFKGTRILDLAHLNVGDTITKTSGEYDIPKKNLSAQTVVIYIDSSIFKPRNYTSAKLLETPSISEASSIKVLIDGTTYTINMTPKTLILKADRSATTLQRFVKGDSIRLYGTLRETDEPIIDAEVIRNTSL